MTRRSFFIMMLEASLWMQRNVVACNWPKKSNSGRDANARLVPRTCGASKRAKVSLTATRWHHQKSFCFENCLELYNVCAAAPEGETSRKCVARVRWRCRRLVRRSVTIIHPSNWGNPCASAGPCPCCRRWVCASHVIDGNILIIFFVIIRICSRICDGSFTSAECCEIFLRLRKKRLTSAVHIHNETGDIRVLP